MSSRNEYFDFLRGVAIMMVVAIHTVPHVTGYNSWQEDFILVVRQIMNCAVPLFLAISGYFLSRKVLDNKSNILNFWKKQISRVLIPMIIWGMGWFVAAILINHSLSNIFLNLILLFCGGFSVYYFVALIIQCYIILPILTKCNWGGVIACGMLSLVAIVITSYYINYNGNNYPLLLYAGPIYLWIIFFMLGIYIAKNPNKDYLTIGITVTLIGLILQIIESKFLLEYIGKGIGIKTSSFIFSAGVILCALSQKTQEAFKSSKITQYIAWIGEVSFGVYLIHNYCITLFLKMTKTDNWFIMWGLSLALTLFIIIVMKRIIPEKPLKKYFGF